MVREVLEDFDAPSAGSRTALKIFFHSNKPSDLHKFPVLAVIPHWNGFCLV